MIVANVHGLVIRYELAAHLLLFSVPSIWKCPTERAQNYILRISTVATCLDSKQQQAPTRHEHESELRTEKHPMVVRSLAMSKKTL